MGSFVQLKDGNGSVIIPNAPLPIIEIQGSSGIVNMEPGYIYQAGQLTDVTITLVPSSTTDYNAEYFLSFQSGATPTTVTWPQGLTFANSSSAPTIVANAYYEISIRDNLCIVQVFGVDTGGGGGGGGGSVTFDEVGSYTPKFGNLGDNGNQIFPRTLKPIISVSGTTPIVAMDDGYVYVCGSLTSLTFTLTASQMSEYVAEYEIRFQSGSTATIINWPTGLTFEERPTIAPNSYTHIRITGGNVKCFNYEDITNYGVTPPVSGGSDVDFTITDNTLTPNFGILKYQTYNVVPFSSVPYEQVSGTSVTITLDPGKIYVAGQLTDLDFNLGTNTHSDYLGIYHIRFESGSTATSVTWPSGLLFKDGVTPTIDANKTYEIDIVDNLCVVTFYA